MPNKINHPNTKITRLAPIYPYGKSGEHSNNSIGILVKPTKESQYFIVYVYFLKAFSNASKLRLYLSPMANSTVSKQS